MAVFFGTLLIFGLSCLALSLGLLIDGRTLKGGCGHKPGVGARCAGCPNSKNRAGSGAARGETEA